MERFNSVTASITEEPVVKICGLQTVEAAEHALESDANLIGIICVPNRKRTIQPQIAKQISALIHNNEKYKNKCLVGVFRNQPKEEVKQLAYEYDVDVVQLHGDEDWKAYQSYIEKPVIKRVIFPRDCDEVINICKEENQKICLPLFDSESGGTGEILDWNAISDWSQTSKNSVKFILAGGLTPDNVHTAIELPGVIGVDVSGGVETNNIKDFEKIEKFVQHGKQGILN